MMSAMVNTYPLRCYLAFAVFFLWAAALTMRAVQLQFTDHEKLQSHGEARYLRDVKVNAHRGNIYDRHGEPLAISTPVSSVWVNPKKIVASEAQWQSLAGLLEIPAAELQRTLTSRRHKDFIYLKRQLPPDVAAQIKALGLPGLGIERAYRRYYPTSEVLSHVVGFTNVDDQGQEGIELAYDKSLSGQSGVQRVIKDRLGNIIEQLATLQAMQPGQDLYLSIDKRLQHVAYRELKAAINEHQAQAGSMVILDAASGEVLAMVNQPAYNPNSRSDMDAGRNRNRAVTDLFEPGSTLKPFTVAAALESGEYTSDAMIDTGNGEYQLGDYTIKDTHAYGRLDMAGVIARSSNIGVAQMALRMEPARFWQLLSHAGFGRLTGSGFPGEAAGMLKDYGKWREIERATLAYGYGVSVSAVQLAQAYSAFANAGVIAATTFTQVASPAAVSTRRVMRADTAEQVRKMMEGVVSQGTGRLALVPGYRVAGKTGTVHKSRSGGYEAHRYQSLFAGLIPASNPRLVAVVLIDDPQAGAYFGGQVAAPVFSRVMQNAVRLLNIPPDDAPQSGEQTLFAYVSASGSAEAFDDLAPAPHP